MCTEDKNPALKEDRTMDCLEMQGLMLDSPSADIKVEFLRGV